MLLERANIRRNHKKLLFSFSFVDQKTGNIGKFMRFNLIRTKPEKVTHDLSLRNLGRDIGVKVRLKLKRSR